MSTDYAKWADASLTWGAQNPSRAELAASLIPAGAHVLDLGAGSMVLKQFLPAGCRYTPSDIYDRGDDCIVADLNRGEFPPGQYDAVVMLGVLEYVVDTRFALAQAAKAAPRLVLTYGWFNPDDASETRALREYRGWLSHLTQDELEAELSAAGYRVTAQPYPRWYVATTAARS